MLEAVRAFCMSEKVEGVQLFLFTDNTTVEGCFYNGTSSSQILFELVLNLRQLEMEHSLHLFVVHIAGTRMIWCGVDRLFRGDLDSGLLCGSSPLNFVDLHLPATTQSPCLEGWIISWLPANS